MTRLQKILAAAGLGSRRKIETWIRAGLVEVNGRRALLGDQADPESDTIALRGEILKFSVQKTQRYYAYYKPRGQVVTKQDELGREGIFAQLDLAPQVNAVGRLDKDSEGLLLLSDDGDFVHRYTHPSFGIVKTYELQIDAPLTPEAREDLLRGIVENGETLRALAVEALPRGREYWLRVRLGEGKKRELRRMMEWGGRRVLRLIRVQHGAVRLENLQPGQLKEIAKPQNEKK